LADLDAEQFSNANDGLWTRGLLIRRRIADDDLAFFATWCPAGTSIETLVAVEGHRWAIEDGFETAKNGKTSSGAITTRVDLAWLAPSRVPGDARLGHEGRDPTSR
jgi:SRSO17 transposase